MSTPSLKEALSVYLRIGLLSFGGPAGQIALMQDEIVTQRKWIRPPTFQRGLNVAMLLPGPEAQQLATWLGWRLHGIKGGIAAGLSFILPGAALMIGLAWIAANYGEVPIVSAIFYGLQPPVLVIVARAVWTLGKRSLHGGLHWAIAMTAFLGLWAFGFPFPLIVALAALAGFALPRQAVPEADPQRPVSKTHIVRIVGIFSILTAIVFITTRALLGATPFDDVAQLFTSAAFVSFGGAYALLPYVADRAVETYGWLSASQMLNGLAIAEATPGPLILVNVYAGYFAGHPGQGAITAALACFYTFTPSFMLILAAAPYVEALQNRIWIRQALAGVSAAVVGVVLNLAVYLSAAALIPQGWQSLDVVKLGLLGAFAALSLWRNPPMIMMVGLGAALGLVLYGIDVVF